MRDRRGKVGEREKNPTKKLIGRLKMHLDVMSQDRTFDFGCPERIGEYDDKSEYCSIKRIFSLSDEEDGPAIIEIFTTSPFKKNGSTKTHTEFYLAENGTTGTQTIKKLKNTIINKMGIERFLNFLRP